MAGDLNRTLTAAITRVVGQVMNAYGNERAGRRLKPLDWSVTSTSGALTGYVPVDCPEGEVAIAAAAWSWALGLTLAPANPNMAGLVTYTGEVEGRQVVIWGVTDRDIWESAPGGAS
jgi:hydrogenase/urease accessory protein HupE